MRLAAERTFADDPWEEPAPAPVREDPAARTRAILRAAAQSLAAKDRQGAPPPPPAAPPPPVEVDLDDAWVDDDEWDDDEADDDAVEVDAVEVDEVDDEAARQDDLDHDAWDAPEVLDDAPPEPTPPTPVHPAQFEPAQFEPAQFEAAQFEPAPFEAPARREPKAARRGGSGSKVAVRVLLVLLVLGAVVGAVLVVASLLRDEGVDYSKLKVGDCFDSSSSNEVRGIRVKPCQEPHNSEIFFLVTHPAGPNEPYPGKDPLVQFAADACLGAPLTEYLGIPLEQSALKDFEIVPQESAWKDGRRALVCGVDTGGAGDISESVKGSRR